MLSYQHAYHAGNMADVHKHALLAWMLEYMTRKDKPLTYMESHAGRGLYDTTDEMATKTGEAAQGIAIARKWFHANHPYAQALDKVTAEHGRNAYPGSPMVAAHVLRPSDPLFLSELHPQEFGHLQQNMKPHSAICQQRDGWEMALSQCPPDPRRGLLLIDPSFEIKTDYETIPDTIRKLNRKWPVGVIALWYPILTDGPHVPMVNDLKRNHPDAFSHEVSFPPARIGHRMVGSGMFVINPPFGLEDEGKWLSTRFANLE
ncbi:23S rRNA (adenine2030-N6)-methyltransferase [Loktanella ponticola]|uniref:Ribosomal RNA large subunit methyltransferase J n=1 Tax=Yoonia ponticola TaxID=1524255 RepID=A0A7W9F004_9RHOB|nr:23S rRNA (adenine(2030)-N(6))-methyltransferase RlmJ [Yoonia ponticola]MBB5722710.1 23S rRNA (adenine2030-N6)-methyltransferase [Yoonia ponticola]